MSCELFETVVLPLLPDAGAPEADDLVGWRARRHRAECADCSARAARFEGALASLSLASDLPALGRVAWPRLESAAAHAAAQPARDSERAKARARAQAAADRAEREAEDAEGFTWRVAFRAALVGVAVATVVMGLEYVRLESDGFAFLRELPSAVEGVRHSRLDAAPVQALSAVMLIGFACAVPQFLSRLFCQNGQCLA